jgi:hypothetical protein
MSVNKKNDENEQK